MLSQEALWDAEHNKAREAQVSKVTLIGGQGHPLYFSRHWALIYSLGKTVWEFQDIALGDTSCSPGECRLQWRLEAPTNASIIRGRWHWQAAVATTLGKWMTGTPLRYFQDSLGKMLQWVGWWTQSGLSKNQCMKYKYHWELICAQKRLKSRGGLDSTPFIFACDLVILGELWYRILLDKYIWYMARSTIIFYKFKK